MLAHLKTFALEGRVHSAGTTQLRCLQLKLSALVSQRNMDFCFILLIQTLADLIETIVVVKIRYLFSSLFLRESLLSYSDSKRSSKTIYVCDIISTTMKSSVFLFMSTLEQIYLR